MKHHSLSIVTLLLLTACAKDPTADKPKATVSAALSTASNSPGAAAAIVPLHFSGADSKLTFVGAKLTGQHDGSFASFTGTLNLVNGDFTKSSVNVEVDMMSVSADVAKLTGHLKSPDFFDVAKFPKATFQSTSIAPLPNTPSATHTVTGNLSLHGVTRAISFPATLRGGATGVEVQSEFGINRKDFGIVYPGMPDDLIKDEVLLKLTIKAKSQP
jgi:polyisoprenoid-binding protein YceI